MPDVFTKEKRSEVMSVIRSSGNKSTEIAIISVFKKNHIKGWRRKYNLPGKPDFVFPKQKLIVFTDGCFWHGHNCRIRKSGDNWEYWEAKISNNKRRDKKITRSLRYQGWTVIRIWECELEKKKYHGKIQKIITLLE